MPHRNRSAPAAAFEADWQAALQGDRRAFRTAMSRHLHELTQAARHEVRYRVAVGDFEPDDPRPEELVAEVFLRAWQERYTRPQAINPRAWLHALLFRTADALAKRKDQVRSHEAVSLDDDFVPPQFLPEEGSGWDDVIDAHVNTPEQTTIAEEVLFKLDPRSREIVLMHELRGVPIPEIAVALGVPEANVRAILNETRRRIRAAISN